MISGNLGYLQGSYERLNRFPYEKWQSLFYVMTKNLST